MAAKAEKSLKARALQLLATREHSRLELARKLAAKAKEGDDVNAVVERMAETGLQSDSRFAQSFVRSRAARLGAARIKRELLERGVAAEVAQAAVEQELEGDELTRARAAWSKKFGELPADAREWARQARFLQARGFTAEVIRKLLKDPFNESA